MQQLPPPAPESDPVTPAVASPSPVVEATPIEEMGFLDHLEELRWALLKGLMAFALGAALVTIFIRQVAGLLMWPYEFAVAGREHTAALDGLISNSFFGVFSVVFNLLLVGGLALSGPFIIYFLGDFISPGLTDRERRLLIPGCILGFLLFITGGAFSFFCVVPTMLKASVIFNDLMGFTLLVRADDYYGLLTWSVLGVGLAFEFPMLLLILIFLGVLPPEKLREWRRFSVVLFLVVAAVVTPGGDPISLILLSMPMYLLYELAILLSGPVLRLRDSDEPETAE